MSKFSDLGCRIQLLSSPLSGEILRKVVQHALEFYENKGLLPLLID